MADLERLVRAHAYWADKIRDLKNQASYEWRCCAKDRPTMRAHKPSGEPVMDYGPTCIQEAINEMSHDHHCFDDLDEVMAEMEACDHCWNMRQLAKDRKQAIRRLGAVRAALTRAGRNLQEQA